MLGKCVEINKYMGTLVLLDGATQFMKPLLPQLTLRAYFELPLC